LSKTIYRHNLGLDMDNILQSIKKLIGISEEHTSFDEDILVYINTALSTIKQASNITSEEITEISSETTWSNINLKQDIKSNLKTYLYLKVKLLFDPPASSTISAVIEKQISELEWRINIATDKIK
jgi:hypothetical protein